MTSEGEPTCGTSLTVLDLVMSVGRRMWHVNVAIKAITLKLARRSPRVLRCPDARSESLMDRGPGRIFS